MNLNRTLLCSLLIATAGMNLIPSASADDAQLIACPYSDVESKGDTDLCAATWGCDVNLHVCYYGDCDINAGPCYFGNCDINTGFCYKGDCEVNAGACIYGNCTINLGVCGWGGSCFVNPGICYGNCFINVGYCYGYTECVNNALLGSVVSTDETDGTGGEREGTTVTDCTSEDHPLHPDPQFEL